MSNNFKVILIGVLFFINLGTARAACPPHSPKVIGSPKRDQEVESNNPFLTPECLKSAAVFDSRKLEEWMASHKPTPVDPEALSAASSASISPREDRPISSKK